MNEEKVKIKITIPRTGYKFVYSLDGNDRLVIEATATVTPSKYASEVEWNLTDIGDKKATYSPEKGLSTRITVEGLPEDNSGFGHHILTAQVKGKALDWVAIEVFFQPKATNHPGEGSGKTPNWFYYWGQTSAMTRDKNYIVYVPELKSDEGYSAVGRYQQWSDTLALTNLVLTGSCKRPAGGPTSKGIDCFGETIMHEWQHREEELSWFRSYSGTSKEGFWGLAARIYNIAVKGIDKDGDGLPGRIERAHAGCRDRVWKRDWFSCNLGNTPGTRPFAEVKDREIFAYYVGWQWVITSADSEDWSKYGKQW